MKKITLSFLCLLLINISFCQGNFFGTHTSITTPQNILFISDARSIARTELSVDVPFTLPSNANFVVISINSTQGALRTGGTPSFSGGSLTQAAVSTYEEVWYINNPTTGSNTLIIPNTSLSKLYVEISWYEYTGSFININSTNTNSGTGTNVTTTISTSNNISELIYQTVTLRQNAVNQFGYTAYSDTHIWAGVIDAIFGVTHQYGVILGNGSNRTLFYTLTNSMQWSTIGVCFNFN